MRLITTAVLLLAVSVAVPATAEPPPQAATSQAPAVTVSDASYAAVLPAVTATQVDTLGTARQAPNSTATTIDTARAIAPDKSDGHGLGFWSLVAGVFLLAAIGGYTWYTRSRSEPSVSSTRSNVPDYDENKPPPRRHPRE